MNPTASDVVEEASACAALIALRTAHTRDDPVEAGHSASGHDTAVTSEPTLEPASASVGI